MAWFRRADGRVNGCAVTRDAAEVATRLADMAAGYPMTTRGKAAAARVGNASVRAPRICLSR